MTTYTPTVLQPGLVLTTALQTLYTSAGGKTVLRAVSFTNTSASAVSITVNLVRGTTAGKAIISARSLAPGETYVSRELPNQVLAQGDAFEASASAAASINVFASGLVF